MRFRFAVAFAAIAMLVSGLALAQDQEKDQAPQPQPPAASHGWLGAKLAGITDEIANELGLDSTDGVLIAEVLPGTPAEAAGLKEKDVILKMDDTDIKELPDLQAKMRQSKPGQVMSFSIMRGKETKEMKVTLGNRPPTTQPR